MVDMVGDPDREDIGTGKGRAASSSKVSVPQVIRMPDPVGGGSDLCAGQCSKTGIWAWFRLLGHDPEIRSAKSCTLVQVCEGDEAAQLEDLFFREGFHLLPCKIGGEIPALIAY